MTPQDGQHTAAISAPPLERGADPEFGAISGSGSKKVRRILTVVFAVLLVVGFIASLASNKQASGAPMSPTSTRPDGFAGIVGVLESHGVDVVIVDSLDEAIKELDANSTLVLLTRGTEQPADVRRIVQSNAEVVLLAPEFYDSFHYWGIDHVLTPVSGEYARAECEEPAANAAAAIGPINTAIDTSEFTLDGPNDCFPVTGGVFSTVSPVNSQVSLLADARVFTNENLKSAGNASYGITKMGKHPKVVWVDKKVAIEVYGGRDPSRSVPPFLPATLFGVLLTILMLAFYRARRFGALVPEPMPVVVPAGEAERGRARLYQRSKATVHAAAALRASTIAKYGKRVGLTPSSSAPDVIPAIASATNKPADYIADLLYNRPINTETELAALARELAALDRQES